jgi:hypothetical protein
LSNCAQVVHQVRLGHANTRINDGKGVVGLVRLNVNEQLRLGIQDRLVSQGEMANLVKSIARVGNELAKENVLVGVKGVDDQREQLVDLSLEGEGLDVGHIEKFVA